MRRPILSAAAPACLLIGLTPVAAAADVAPPGAATATAARVGDLVQVSQSKANADQTKGNAEAAVISVQGKPILGTGGSDDTEGETNGSLIDTVDKSPVRVQVAPWHTRATGSKAKGSTKRSSSASAALARVEIPDQAKVGILTSDASAEHTDTQSTGKSTSNAVELSLGNSMQLVLLHSEVNSAAKGNSYLASVNGTKIGTQEQLTELCSLDLSGVAALSCLTASGGQGNNGVTSGGAEVLGVQTSLAGLNPASAFATTGTMGAGTLAPIVQAAAPVVAAAEAPRAAAAAPAAALPRTGVAAASLASSGAAALLTGLSLKGLSRRRRRRTA